MDVVMIKLFNMSITAMWLILAVIILRAILKKAPKYINLIMWALVGFRLICPFNFESMFSLIPTSETIPGNIQATSSPSINTGIDAINEIVNPAISELSEMPYSIGYNPIDMLLKISFLVWVAGIAVMLVYSAVSYLKLHRMVRASIRYKENIYLCDNIKSPFILGIIRPRIYLPSDINANQINPVIAHEKAHIRRFDHILKPLGFAVMSIHWFNPLVWIAYSLFCRDIEYACDEKVIKDMKSEEKKTYSEALLSLSISKRNLAVCPLAFGEIGVKNRIKSVLSYKKPTLWIIIISVIALAGVAIGFMTTPKNDSIDGYHYIDKYFYQDIIGEDRANTELRDYRYRIGDDMIITRFDGDGTGNATVLGVLVKENINDHELDLILETLPSKYSKNQITETYVTSGPYTDKYIFIRFRNSDFIGAFIPTDGDGNRYVMSAFKLKRNHDITIEAVTDFDKEIIIGADIPTTAPYAHPEELSTAGTENTTSFVIVDNGENVNPYFNAKVLEVNEKNILVEPLKGEVERNSANKIYVSTDVISANPVPELKKGDKVRIIYNGEIMETYPAEISKVFAIYTH